MKKKYTQEQKDRALRKLARAYNFWNKNVMVPVEEERRRRFEVHRQVLRVLQKHGIQDLKP